MKGATRNGAKDIFLQTQPHSYYNVLQNAIVNNKPDHIIMNIATMGGRALVAAKDKSSRGRNALHIACLRQVSSAVLLKLIKCGGREAVLARDNFGSTALHFILHMDKNNVEVIRKLLEVGGRDLIAGKCSMGRNGLFTAVSRGASKEVIEELIRVGGNDLLIDKDDCGLSMLEKLISHKKMSANFVSLLCLNQTNILMGKNELGLTLLQQVLRLDKHNYPLIKTLVEIGGRKLVIEKCPSGWNGLCTAFLCNAPAEVIDLLYDVGGKELLIEKNDTGSTVLERLILMKSNHEQLISKIIHTGVKELINTTTIELILRTRASNCTEIMNVIVGIGGREIISQTSKATGWNAFHYACFYNAPIDIIKLFLRVGGNDIVFQTDSFGATPLLLLPTYENIPVIQELINVGGKELLMMQDHTGLNILHKVCRVKNGDFVNVIKMLLDAGGRDLVLAKTSCQGFFADWTALHYSCFKQTSLKSISTLINVGEACLLTATNGNRKTALHQMLGMTHSSQQTHSCNIIQLLIEKGIKFNVGGAYCIGGLFLSENGEERDEIQIILHSESTNDRRWKEVILPAVVSIDKKCCLYSKIPILHAAITRGKANAQVIKDIINQCKGSVNRTDSLGHVPLEIALHEEIEWNQGLKDIFEAFADAVHRPRLSIGCQYGIKWNNGMKEVMNVYMKGMGVCDKDTGLYPFMLSAAGTSNDLNVTYETMRLTQNVL